MENNMDIKQLAAEAQNGNAHAQFKYAVLLLRNEQLEQAFYWLHKAIALKNVRAIEFFGVLALKGLGMKSDPALAFQYFRTAADAGDAQALIRCAELMFSGKGINRDRDGAMRCIIDAAKKGYPLALRAMGFFMLHQGEANEALSAFRIAAYNGDPHSQYMMAKLSSLPAEANAWMAKAAENGVYLAKKLYIKDAEQTDLKMLKTDIPAIEQCLMLLTSKSVLLDKLYPEMETISVPLQMKTIKKILSPLEAEYLINSSAGLLKPAKVVSADSAITLEQIRTGMTASLCQLIDIVVDWLVERICKVANLPLSHAEAPAIIRYLPGEMYKQHGDYLPDNSVLSSKINGGQRTNTVLVYLNDGFEGGCTEFNLLNIVVKPEQGQLLTFSNVSCDGKSLVLSQHTGQPVVNGEKWLLSIWFREYSCKDW